jgi:outer membrane receptor protein involved in Fe transport
VPSAKVTLTNDDQGAGSARVVTTASEGSFVFSPVLAGKYTVTVEMTGFKKYVRKGIVLNLNQVATLDITLQVGTAVETIEVTGAPPLVDTTSTQLGAVVNERAVSELPLAQRDTYQLLQLQPGVQSQLGVDSVYGSDRAGVVSVNGGRGRDNNFTVNGGDGNDQFANLPAIQPSPDSIAEFRVLTNTFDAEYGRNSGAVVNVVTKSGTNDFHGNFYEFFRNELVSQATPLAGISYTFNAPRSEHRGVELAADWKFLPGWRFTAAYTYLDEIYTEYTENITNGAVFSFNRVGNKIPGISPNELTTRLGYDEMSGPLVGLGAFVEVQWKDSFYMDNANLLKAPGYELVNLNVHYKTDLASGYFKSLSMYLEVRNLFDRTYVASANNIGNSVTGAGVQNPASVLANTTGSIYAGSPRAFVAGMKVAFR